MDLRGYLEALRRHLPLIGACVAVVVAAAALISWQVTPVFESSARVYVSAAQATTDDALAGGLLSEQRVAAYVEIVESDLLAQQVVDDLPFKTTVDELNGQVDASVVGETSVLEIRVKDADAEQAQLITQTYAEALVVTAAEIETPDGTGDSPVKATIIDPADLPSDPVFPKPVLNLVLALIAGLVIGVAVALLRDLLDNTITSVEDLGPEAPAVLGALTADPAKRLITELDAHAPRVEAFRVLRTNVSFVDVDNPHKVLVVTSPVQEEGKTTTAVNLALSIAQAGVHTLLIDADLRRPKIADLLGLDSSVGVTTVLLGKVAMEEAVQSHTVPGLDVLTSGSSPPNPAELLQSQAMHSLLDKVRLAYDVVIIDSPPLLPVTDAALLTAQSDGAILVLRHGKTTRDQWQTAVARLDQVDAVPLGVVMNMVPASEAYLGYEYRPYGPDPSTRGKHGKK